MFCFVVIVGVLKLIYMCMSFMKRNLVFSLHITKLCLSLKLNSRFLKDVFSIFEMKVSKYLNNENFFLLMIWYADISSQDCVLFWGSKSWCMKLFSKFVVLIGTPFGLSTSNIIFESMRKKLNLFKSRIVTANFVEFSKGPDLRKPKQWNYTKTDMIVKSEFLAFVKSWHKTCVSRQIVVSY